MGTTMMREHGAGSLKRRAEPVLLLFTWGLGRPSLFSRSFCRVLGWQSSRVLGPDPWDGCRNFSQVIPSHQRDRLEVALPTREGSSCTTSQRTDRGIQPSSCGALGPSGSEASAHLMGRRSGLFLEWPLGVLLGAWSLRESGITQLPQVWRLPWPASLSIFPLLNLFLAPFAIMSGPSAKGLPR